MTEVFVMDVNGLHARPAGRIANLANAHGSDVYIIKDEVRYNAKSIINLLGMGILYGDRIAVDVADDKDGLLEKEICCIIEGAAV